MNLVILIGPSARHQEQIREQYYSTYEVVDLGVVAAHYKQQIEIDENVRYRIQSNIQSNLDTVICGNNLSYNQRKKYFAWAAGRANIIGEMIISEYSDNDNLDNFRVPMMWEGYAAINWRYCETSSTLMGLSSVLAHSKVQIKGKSLQTYSRNLAEVCPNPKVKTACIFLNLGRDLNKECYEGYSAYLLLTTCLESEYLEHCAQIISWAHVNPDNYPIMDANFKEEILAIQESEERL